MRGLRNHGVPAVVVGGGVNGLGVVRSLAAEGVDVWCVDTDLSRPTMKTRHGSKYRVNSLGDERLVQGLVEISARLDDRAVLFLTEEDSVRVVSRYRDELGENYRFSMPEDKLIEALMHKGSFHAVASSLGFPVPETVHVDRIGGLGAVDSIGFPCIVKPAFRNQEYSQKFKKAYLVENYEELAGLYAQMEPVFPEVIVQQWIEGEDSDIYFCLQYTGQNGETVSSFTGRKLWSWPPGTGGTASCTVGNIGDELESLTSGFFRAVGFRGLGSMEFKWDRRTERFLMIEPTVCRTDYQEEVATLNGINIPYAAYLSELGEPVPQMSVSGKPVIWRDGSHARWSAELQPGARKSTSHGGRACDAYWRASDPAPGIFSMAQRIARRWRRG